MKIRKPKSTFRFIYDTAYNRGVFETSLFFILASLLLMIGNIIFK